MATQFWIENPCELFRNIVLFPNKDMSKVDKLNALSRLIIVITIIMYFMKFEHWLIFLLISLFIIIILQYSGTCDGADSTNNINVDANDVNNKKENFTVVPTYVGTDFSQTTVAPTYAEEWVIPPPAYDLYTQVPEYGENKDTFNYPLKPQSYPYGQYMTRTNLLPSDEYYTHLGCGGTKEARSYINGAFLRHDLAHRENISRIYKKKLNRRFKHNTNDTYSPFASY